MKFPISLDKLQFSARLIPDDLTLINSVIPQLLPDRDLSEDIAARDIMMVAFEKSASKLKKENQSNPADQQKIIDLKAEVDRLKSENDEKGKEVLRLQNELSERLDKESISQAAIESLENIINETEGRLKNLERFKPIPNELRGQLPELTKVLLVMYARKVSAIKKQEIRPFDVLISLFNRYITKKEVELPGFPFVISDSEIRKAKAEIDGKEPAE